jgi:hypothetical protein
LGVSIAYNFPAENNKIILLKEFESVTQKVLFGNAVLIALMSQREYVMSQNDSCSRESSVYTLVFGNKVSH